MIYFDAEPDRYGRFGHQTFRLLTAVLAAEAFDGFFIPQTFRYFAYNGNTLIDFSRHPRCKDYIPGCKIVFVSQEIDSVGNDKFDLSRIDCFGELVHIISSYKQCSSNYLVKLPFDQEPGLLLKYLYCKDNISRSLKDIVCKNIAHKPGFDIVIHVRRGDVDLRRHPSWFIPDDVYDHLLCYLLHKTSSLKIAVITQNDLLLPNALKATHDSSSTIKVFVSDQTINSQCELRDLNYLLNSRLIIGGQSSFSQVPSLLMNIPYIELYNSGNRQHQPHMFRPCLSISSNSILHSPRDALRPLLDIVATVPDIR